MGCFAVTEEAPLTRAGAKPGKAHADHRIEERALTFRRDRVGDPDDDRALIRSCGERQLRLGPRDCPAIHARGVDQRPHPDGCGAAAPPPCGSATKPQRTAPNAWLPNSTVR